MGTAEAQFQLRFDTAPVEQPTDKHLLARLLRPVTPCAEVMASQLVQRFEGLAGVLGADAAALRLEDVPENAVALLRVVQQVAERAGEERLREAPVLGSWPALEAYLRIAMAGLRQEQMRMLFLDHRNRLICSRIVGEGSPVAAPAYPREIARIALTVGAMAAIAVHNHPSGDPAPSRADIELTRALGKALAALEIVLHDHIIVGAGKPVSLRALGLLD